MLVFLGSVDETTTLFVRLIAALEGWSVEALMLRGSSILCILESVPRVIPRVHFVDF